MKKQLAKTTFEGGFLPNSSKKRRWPKKREPTNKKISESPLLNKWGHGDPRETQKSKALANKEHSSTTLSLGLCDRDGTLWANDGKESRERA